MTNFELFEDYLEDQLAPEEKSRFEQRLKNDPEFSGEFEQYRSIQSDMQFWQQTEIKRLELKHTLGQITGKKNEKALVRPIGRYLWRAAAIFVLLAGTWWLMVPSSSRNNEQLFAQYSAGENISISRGTIADSLWEKVSALLYDKKYPETLPVLQQIIRTGKDSITEARVWLGYCLMMTNKDSAAENIFTQPFVKDKGVAERVAWYKALLYLKTGEKVLCIAALTQIQSSGGAYAGKAAALLKEKIH